METLSNNWQLMVFIYLSSWVISSNEYIEQFLNWLSEIKFKFFIKLFFALLYEVLTCIYCCTLWLTFFICIFKFTIFESLFMAMLNSWIAYQIYKYNGR